MKYLAVLTFLTAHQMLICMLLTVLKIYMSLLCIANLVLAELIALDLKNINLQKVQNLLVVINKMVAVFQAKLLYQASKIKKKKLQVSRKGDLYLLFTYLVLFAMVGVLNYLSNKLFCSCCNSLHSLLGSLVAVSLTIILNVEVLTVLSG